jgi:hypothetical protein
MTGFAEFVKKATPMKMAATLKSPSKRQLKPVASPGGRFEGLEGGVEFGESDMMSGRERKKPNEMNKFQKNVVTHCYSGVSDGNLKGKKANPFFGQTCR